MIYKIQIFWGGGVYVSTSYRTPSWHHEAMLDRSQSGRWMLVCTVWIPTGRLTQQTQITGWRKNAGQTKMMSFIASQFSPLLLNISFIFPQVNMCFFLFSFLLSLYVIYLFPPPLALSLISLSLSHLSASSQFLSWSNSMCILGCRGNCGRPHKRVGEQKTQRPSSTEEWREKGRDGEKIKFHFSLGGVWRIRGEKK